jgi:hypothetical protein
MRTSQTHIAQTILLVALLAGGAVVEGEDVYTTEVSFIGGGGSISTNSDYSVMSSWRNAIQTSVAYGGGFDHASGFLATQAEVPVSLRILSFEVEINPTPRFRLTVPTKPGWTYFIQFADADGGTFAWRLFANTNQSVGVYYETNASVGNFTFVDDFTSASSGNTLASTFRFYRIMAVQPGQNL